MAQAQNSQDKFALFPDMSGSRLGKLMGMFVHQPAATSSTPIRPNDAVPAMAQQQLPASSALLETAS
eukprot:CAMPEP_0172732662 /NCGR_PEP_ID=MMETSP1074-20121228/104964_1 /TAXON_ID=2916 /ORGANISM="Ceratium fusus, Strain PA161109" /LENGTH=66 /DNA_ID=CAMNT_0013561003 /DNA_START=303 /DNA_END=500 /DNA_ORIENTATION=+